MTPQTYADLAHENMHLLAALWRNIWNDHPSGQQHRCLECLASGPEKHLVKHQPGCALFGQDPALLAQMDAFDAVPEPV